MDLKDYVGGAATVFTISVFLSGIEICRKIWRNKSTKDISPLPFLCGLISSTFWLRYGLLIDDKSLIVVNTVGAILQALYICWYCRFNVLEVFHRQLLIVLLIISFFYIFTTFCIVPEKARFIAGISCCTAGVIFMGSPLASLVFHRQLLNVLLIISFFYIFTTFCIVPEKARFIAGISCCTAGVIFMGSPLASLARVIETRNVDSLPFSMILSTFVMASLWFFYGILTDDTFVQVPNFLGTVLSLCQLSLFVWYRDKKKYYELSSIA